MGTAKIIEVIDYIAVYYTLPGSRESRCELCLVGCLSLGGGGRGAALIYQMELDLLGLTGEF